MFASSPRLETDSCGITTSFFCRTAQPPTARKLMIRPSGTLKDISASSQAQPISSRSGRSCKTPSCPPRFADSAARIPISGPASLPVENVDEPALIDLPQILHVIEILWLKLSSFRIPLGKNVQDRLNRLVQAVGLFRVKPLKEDVGFF